MPDTDKWYSGKIGSDDKTEFVRFNYSRKYILDDASYSKAIWFETRGIETSDIDNYLSSLDELEDSIKATMESQEKCHFIMTLTGADYRDLVFAFGGLGMEFDAPIRSLLKQYPERFNVQVREREFSPYPMLITQLDQQLS